MNLASLPLPVFQRQKATGHSSDTLASPTPFRSKVPNMTTNPAFDEYTLGPWLKGAWDRAKTEDLLNRVPAVRRWAQEVAKYAPPHPATVPALAKFPHGEHAARRSALRTAVLARGRGKIGRSVS
jgi:hypothetical protein